MGRPEDEGLSHEDYESLDVTPLIFTSIRVLAWLGFIAGQRYAEREAARYTAMRFELDQDS